MMRMELMQGKLSWSFENMKTGKNVTLTPGAPPTSMSATSSATPRRAPMARRCRPG